MICLTPELTPEATISLDDLTDAALAAILQYVVCGGVYLTVADVDVAAVCTVRSSRI